MSKLIIFPIATEEAKKQREELAKFMANDSNKGKEWDQFLEMRQKRSEQLFNQLPDTQKKRALRWEEIAQKQINKTLEFMADNCGITINIKEANKKHARSIGKFPSRLTKKEQDQAFLNACVEQGLENREKH